MKKILLFLFVAVLSFGLNAQMLNDFDSNQNVPFEGWPNWPGIVVNPSSSGINTSANCAEWQRTGETWAHAAGMPATAIDFSVNNTFKMKVFSPIPCNVLFKVESLSGSPAPMEIMDTVYVANQWVELSWNFSAAPSNVYNKLVIFFDFASNVDNIFYFDDLELVPGAIILGQINLPIDFEANNVDYTLTDFGGATTVLGTDPVVGTNTCAITTKPVGAQTWAGTTMSTPAGFLSAIPFSTLDSKMSVRVYSPAVGIPVRLKVEDHLDNTHICEAQMPTTVANAWETIEFDFGNPVSGTAALNFSYVYDMASIFFDFDAAGAGDVFYWDDVQFLATVLEQIDLPVTFELPNVNYSVIDFGGTTTELVADPAGGTGTVAKTTKGVGAEVWAGVTVGTEAGFASLIPFTATETLVHMRVYSPAVGIPIIFKFEEHATASNSVETQTLTTVANAWEVMEFDFSNEVAGTDPLDLARTYDKAVIFFDYGLNGAGDIFYWDDIYFGPILNVDELENTSVSIYPVPVSDILFLDGLKDANRIKIYNVLGKEILSSEQVNGNSASIDVSSLIAGVYFISILQGSKIMTTKKLVKE
ncbi:MAG: T9SS type A sorting domain-containing protein [Bacteroidales bacterium]|nr:T9SS type A sorting domain-containing protein [Bacteroidales bacterium]MCF8454370.1 T9SS type A sorting domain-containing protein [Bacteroidales bacterium]